MRHPSHLVTLQARYKRQGGRLVTDASYDPTAPVLMHGPVAGALLFAKYNRATRRWTIMHGDRVLGLNTYKDPPTAQLRALARALKGY